MINNLAEYFDPMQKYYLDKVSYNRFENNIHDENNSVEYLLNCADDLMVDLLNDGVRVTITRHVSFEPKDVYELTVSFGALLRFNSEKTMDWTQVNLKEEFRNNGVFVTANLIHHISLLIAEITSSYGQMPLILAPDFIDRNNEQR